MVMAQRITTACTLLIAAVVVVAEDPEDAVTCRSERGEGGQWKRPICFLSSDEDEEAPRRRRDLRSTYTDDHPYYRGGFDDASISVPGGDERHQIRVISSIGLGGYEASNISYNTIKRSNTTQEDGAIFGKVFDIFGMPVFEISAKASTASGASHQSTGSFEKQDVEVVSNYPDFSSLLPRGDTGDIFMITHFESPLPSEQYLLQLQLNESTCEFSVGEMRRVDWSAYHGLWTPCAGSVSPWGTHLGSEEYEPDAKHINIYDTWQDFWSNNSWSAAQVGEFVRYYNIYGENLTMSRVREHFRPYRYGFPLEIVVRDLDTVVPAKRFAMGRRSNELHYVMPDRRTVYMTDDGTNTMLTRFVSDAPGDLSSGQLYVARFSQTSASNGGHFEVSWVDLGHATDADIRNAIESANGIHFSDIFDFEDPDETDGSCPSTGFIAINAAAFGPECLRLKEGQELLASRLETRRYAAMLGGTTEFSKMEGFTFDSKRAKAYVSLSSVRYGMEDFSRKGHSNGAHDVGGQNMIRLEYNKCGCVYELAIDDDYVATEASALICGNTHYADHENDCDPNAIANPDNIAMVDENVLAIGEDTSHHVNNALWNFDLESKTLTRVLTAPYGAEITGTYFYDSILGTPCSVLMSVVQHPYGESDTEALASDPAANGIDGYVGYIGPIRRLAALETDEKKEDSPLSPGEVVIILCLASTVAIGVVAWDHLRNRFGKRALYKEASSAADVPHAANSGSFEMREVAK